MMLVYKCGQEKLNNLYYQCERAKEIVSEGETVTPKEYKALQKETQRLCSCEIKK